MRLLQQLFGYLTPEKRTKCVCRHKEMRLVPLTWVFLLIASLTDVMTLKPKASVGSIFENAIQLPVKPEIFGVEKKI